MKNNKRMSVSWVQDDCQIRGEIARYITLSGISMAELAAMLGISRSGLYNKMRDPSKFTLHEYRRLHREVMKFPRYGLPTLDNH